MEACSLFDDHSTGNFDWSDATLPTWTCLDQSPRAAGDSGWDGAFDPSQQSLWENISTDTGTRVASTNFIPPQRDFRSRSSLACTACRSRHSKCDAKRPTCSQCRQIGRSCSYAPSRRGRKDLVRKEKGIATSQEPEVFAANQNSVSSEPEDIQSTTLNVTSPEAFSKPTVDQPLFLEEYFAHFHRAHPFVLPRREFYRRFRANETHLRHLMITMDYIGSLYSQGASYQTCQRQKVEEALQPDLAPSNGFTLQALLIFAIAMQSSREFDVAKAGLDQAVNLALRLGMNTEAYAQEHSDGDRVLAESWRRTWWSLYVVSAIFAAIRYDLQFALYNVDCDTGLPCDEADYEQCDIPNPRTLREYRNREFLAGQQAAFSSFAYLIDLAHALGSILGLSLDNREALEPDVLDVEARMMSWLTYLPESKRLLEATPIGHSDEVIFLAHIVFKT